MRLIDADKLIKEFLNVCRTEFEIKNKCLENENVLFVIQNAPTVTIKEWKEEMPIYIKDAMLEALRPQGEWDYEKVAFYGVCSNCGVAVTSNKAEMFLYEEMREFPHNINFCPNCGADMRGGRE